MNRSVGLIVASLLLSAQSHAGQAWVEAGDSVLRSDLQLLVDAGIAELPLATWPIPVADVERVLAAAQGRGLEESSYAAAIARIRRSIRPEADGSLHVDMLRASGGRAGLLRDFDTMAREDGEVTAGVAMLGDRWAFEARGTFAASPEDGRSWRFDGSHLTARFGNWLLGANTLDRWWGPGNVSSLILSSNARPIPALTLERATSSPFRSRWLRWIGPWRVTGMLGQLEGDREDIDRPLFLGMRASARPLKFIEIGLSRTAQFCGEGRTCDLETFGNVLGFNDTVGTTVSAEDQPGNQLAGWDVRLSSPWRALPLAIYKQDIGEDRIDLRPTDRLAQYGIEAWHGFADGSLLRGYLEYSDTTCGAEGTRFFNCAYTNNLFNVDGYRFHRRAVGHTTDADSETRAAGVRWTRTSGEEWSVELRDADLNRDPGSDRRNTVSVVPSDYQTVELGWRRATSFGDLQVQLGYETIEPQGGQGASKQDRVYGFVGWSRRP